MINALATVQAGPTFFEIYGLRRKLSVAIGLIYGLRRKLSVAIGLIYPISCNLYTKMD